jgi:hypothetical protein
LNLTCAFGGRLESILFRGPPQNPFSTASVKLGHSAMSAAMSGLPESSRRADIGRLSKSAIPVIAAIRLTEYWIGLLRQSALMLAARITLPHFSVSSAISLPKLAGEPGSAATPNSVSRAFILGSARAALISLLSLSTLRRRVFRRADAGPEARLVAWHELTDGCEVRQHRRTRCGCHRQRTKSTGSDVFD